MLLRRDYFILSLAVCKPMTSCHVVVHYHSADGLTSAIVQLGTSVSQYTEYTDQVSILPYQHTIFWVCNNSFDTQSEEVGSVMIT